MHVDTAAALLPSAAAVVEEGASDHVQVLLICAMLAVRCWTAGETHGDTKGSCCCRVLLLDLVCAQEGGSDAVPGLLIWTGGSSRVGAAACCCWRGCRAVLAAGVEGVLPRGVGDPAVVDLGRELLAAVLLLSWLHSA